MSIRKPNGGLDTSDAGNAGDGDFADDLHSEGTEVLGDSPEDVLVLLPDGADVPIVETEAVDGAVDGPPGVSFEDVPLKDVNPLATDPPRAEAPPAENLEDLTSEMDDEFLAPDPPAAPARRSRAERGTEREMPRYYPSPEQGTERKRHRWRAPVAIAALLAVAATGYITFPQWRPYVESYLPGVLTSSAAHAKPAPPPASKKGSAVATKTASPGAGDTKAVDMVRASKEAFREKFLLSIELGYVGEVADE